MIHERASCKAHLFAERLLLRNLFHNASIHVKRRFCIQPLSFLSFIYLRRVLWKLEKRCLSSKCLPCFVALPSVFCSLLVVVQAGGGGEPPASPNPSAVPPNPKPVLTAPIPPNDCWPKPEADPTSVTRIECDNKSFTAVPSLAPYVNLNYLNLSFNFLTTIEGLSGLTQLEWLYLSNNRLTDIGDISGFTNLIGFNLKGPDNRIPCRSVPPTIRATSGCK